MAYSRDRKELLRLHGYVMNGNRYDGMRVIITEPTTTKTVIMPYEPFEREGILGEDTRFVLRFFRQDGQTLYALLPDRSFERKPLTKEQEKLLNSLEDLIKSSKTSH